MVSGCVFDNTLNATGDIKFIRLVKFTPRYLTLLDCSIVWLSISNVGR